MSDELEIREYGQKGEGWSGSDSSRDRAEREEASGVTGWRRVQVHDLIRTKAGLGMTCHEVEVELGIGHGAASAALTHLHRAGHLTRLTERRNGQEPYVLHAFVNGRETAAYRPNANYREASAPMALEAPQTDAQDLQERLRRHGLPGVWAKHLLPVLAEMGVTVTEGGK